MPTFSTTTAVCRLDRVDSSALIAIALNEPDAERCMLALHGPDRAAISAATITDTLIVAIGRDCELQMQAIFDGFGLLIEPVTAVRARHAAEAYRRYGKGWHAAALNFGDTFAYALAKEHDCPLLYIGADFARTDVASALG